METKFSISNKLMVQPNNDGVKFIYNNQKGEEQIIQLTYTAWQTLYSNLSVFKDYLVSGQ